MPLVAIALSYFQKISDHELSVEEHDLLNVVCKNDENWWKVSNRYGETGLVPVNNLAAPVTDETIKIKSRGKTLIRYDSEYEHALSVYKGQEVAIFDKSDDDWWYVGFRGQIGYLPKNIIAEFEPPKGNGNRDLRFAFEFQVIVPSRALCKEGTDVLVTFQKALPKRGQYFVNFKGNQSDFTVLGEFLNDFTLKITTPICSEAEKTKITINHEQFGLPPQLIAEGIDFEFESNTDVTYRLLKTEDAPLNIVHHFLEIFNPKYEDLSDSDIDLVYEHATVRSWKIMEDCYNKYIINNYQYTFMDISEQKDEDDCDVSETVSIDDESMHRDLKRMTEREVILALLSKCVKTKRITQEQAQQIAETLYFKTKDYEPVYEAINYEVISDKERNKLQDMMQELPEEERKNIRQELWGEEREDVRQSLRKEQQEDVRPELLEEKGEDVRKKLQEEEREDVRQELREEQLEYVRQELREEELEGVRQELREEQREIVRNELREEQREDVRQELRQEQLEDVREELRDEQWDVRLREEQWEDEWKSLKNQVQEILWRGKEVLEHLMENNHSSSGKISTTSETSHDFGILKTFALHGPFPSPKRPGNRLSNTSKDSCDSGIWGVDSSRSSITEQYASQEKSNVSQKPDNVPSELTDERKSYQECVDNHVVEQTSTKYNLATTVSELPENVRKKLEECLNKGSEILENDWRSLCKVLNLPLGKENIIAEKSFDNGTKYVLKTWIDRDGQHANVKALILALIECKQGGLAYEIERDLDVKLPDQVEKDIVDEVSDKSLDEKKGPNYQVICDDSSIDESSNDESSNEGGSNQNRFNGNSSNYGSSRDDTLMRKFHHYSHDDHLFQNIFLDDEYNIRKDIHDKLKSLRWICGEYGLARANAKIPHFHLYVSVDYDEESLEKAKDVLKTEIDKKFGSNAWMHFEFRLKRPTTPKLQLLSDIVVRRKDARGTLTMFCCQNGKRYALTCCHVCYFKKDEENSDHEFFEILRKNQNNPDHVKLHLNSNKYFYNPSENQEIRLGNFSNYILQSNADIIAIEVNENAPVSCRKNGRKERSLKEVCTDLNKQFIKAGPIKVKKYGKEQREGEIVDIAFSYYARREGFEITDAVLVKCPEKFLESGESGVLVYFVDENGKEQAFGYGVAEWCRDLKQKPESPTYKFYLCFKLDIALKELFGKENCETCDCFDQNGNYIDDIKEFTSSNASISYTTSINSEPSEPKFLKASSSATTSIKSQPSGSANDIVNNQSSTVYNLQTTYCELPNHVMRKLEERLNKGNEVLEKDWRSLYKALKLPLEKIHIVSEKHFENPTKFVLKTWYDRDGRRASVKTLLLALKKCSQIGLAHEIERDLNVKLPDQVPQNNMDVARDVILRQTQKALNIVRDLPEHLKDALIERLNRFHVDVLSEIATNMLEVQCYVQNSADLMAKLKEKKIRFLFREFRRKDQFMDVVLWMRKKFPVGSTGPLNCDDEDKTEKMNIGIRRKVSIRLNSENYWERFASHRVMDVTIIDIRQFMKSEDPAEEVISRWESKNKSTVGLLYDLLVDCELYNIADIL